VGQRGSGAAEQWEYGGWGFSPAMGLQPVACSLKPEARLG
jgi:hypothetical protein